MNLSENKAFCDTSFFFASLCPHDTNFEKAGVLLEYCKDNAVTLYTTWDIISETATLLRYRLSHKAAVEFLGTVKPALSIIKYDDSIRDAAEKVFKRLSRDKKISFCDAISYVVITGMLDGMPCFTFDRDFKNLGLLVYP
ncbi:MAG: type II toxin-antitoxin system VapC family toxin [Nitrospirae bacterium]|nr:type II toxin-antitoxin system VapC family toxin [Nitrospirota bacterium]